MRLMGSMVALVCGLASTAHAAAPGNVRADARVILDKIISMPSSAGLGQVPAVAMYLADRFRAAGFPEDDIHVLPSGETASLVVRYRGNGKGGKPILLLAHMDVVTAKPEDWERDPFKLIEENGYFFGRGTMDVKGEIALIAATFLRLKAEKFVPTRDLIIAFTGDEETQMDTARELATKYRALTDAEFALNGDGGGGTLDEETGKPRFYALQGAEKSYASFALTARNPGGHSSQPRPDNAIYDTRRCAQGAAGILVPGDVERLDDRQLQGVGSRHTRRVGPGHGEVRGSPGRCRGCRRPGADAGHDRAYPHHLCRNDALWRTCG